ncbi:hypothetical protein WALSEDRAFT_69185 [Wallemia mellicola CBS 633.66]|uniref:DUF1772-domain-containing protein n=1 Tax=Wallemia mellicola (strain ATCC MYA-4683 / CBS 633.66) TaxID=671144 RepID=I4YBJ4_WALMC|nr:hypothetical protein WALSEDRAFT_69185 [Wallemia mellicola CBS 633.66]EIM21336.1 hypothetical protein WALSEDRAFT_69185 [Wallemia mellicola CBS 633.66]|eukprot:XP_006958684.1 hypothetical protein WALSEDRAFT_69185 [Wallemia mellicola CBS 633.66]
MVNLPSPSVLQAIGTGFAGITVGMTASWPLVWYSVLDKTSNSNKVKLLHESYRRATLFMPPSIILTTASYTLARKHFSLPAVLMFSLIPYTAFVVFPVNKKLFAKENYPEADVDADSTVDSLLSKWMYIHSVRVLLAASSTFFGFVELFKLLKSGAY